MALYIVTTKKPDFEWHIGERLELSPEYINTIQYIQADGDELEHIVIEFTLISNTYANITIPLPKTKRVVKWYGDIAKTIIANL